MLDAATKVVNVVDIPVFCDGDTGYGNAVNLKRTVQGYAKAGVACIMLEDQVSVKKRCGHTRGKEVVGFEESIMRIKAAVDAREESGCDILIMARTDARETHGFQHAVDRCQAFVELGADITFLEAPLSVEEMEAYCRHVPGSKMANMLENGKTPILPGDELEKMGFKIAAYPFAVLNASIVGMQKALQQLKEGKSPSNLSFQELQEIVGFDRYFEEEDRYSV
uniref:Carboxyvinyl-carboxyphosphonate phosphorylmutase n=1 Tax=Amorphochlora amoebiformis TaxID=1561963 RepID=A0A7S0DFI2_9EUKA